ncbi:MAG TPA: glycine cleavage system aminomethyltransferase GcvT [Gammaproteobacteria bacterium]|nr:glycine cleavage system aminomethyltransferase GcvT [Gammaproteobacteria bacterium]
MTPLGALHTSLGARMVEFAGYSLPISYKTGIVREHLWTRESASLFDVSHMGQIRVSGAQAAAALESLMPSNLIGLPPGRQLYGVLTNDAGGIIDDLIVANLGDAFLLVVNAACKDSDFRYLDDRIGSQVSIERLVDRALIALQGPSAADVLARFAPEVADLGFMDVIGTASLGAYSFVSRSGYTGEDGFEISLPAEKSESLATHLLAAPEVEPAGLGARDSLRLEAGLCLYGHDIDETTSPVEAGLSFAISPPRRPGGSRPGGFPGYEVVAEQLQHEPSRRRVGLRPDSPIPVREGAALHSQDDQTVGSVTSGGFGPTVGAPVAMGYVDAPAHTLATRLKAYVRGKPVDVMVASVTAVPHRYRRLPG